MKKKIILSVFIVFFNISIYSAIIKVLKTRLLTETDFLSQTITTLKRGNKIKIIKNKGSWLFVKFNNKKGYIHKTTIGKVNTKLIGKRAGTNSTSDKEIALAAKGFSETNERKIRNRKNLYNFKALDWIMKKNVSLKMIKDFKNKGGLK